MPTQRQEISASIQANFPDNTSQFITPTRLRTEQGLFENYVVLNEQTASIIAEAVASSSAGTGLVTTASFNAFTASTNTFTQSIQTQVNALQAATGSYITSAQTGSMSVLSASYASSSTSASYALTASFAINVPSIDTGSFATTGSNQFNGNQSISGSLHQSGTFYPDQIDWISSSIQQGTGSYILTTDSNGVTQYDNFQNIASALQPYIQTGSVINTGSFATTGSNTFNGTNTFTGSVNIQTASIDILIANTVVSSSTIFSSGSNILGDASNDTQTLWGTVNLPSGPLQVTGSVSSTGGFTGSLQGTASYADQALSASWAPSTAFPFSGSAVITGSLTIENPSDVVVFSLTQAGISAYNIKHGGGYDTTLNIPVNATHNFSGSGNNLFRFDSPVTVNGVTASFNNSTLILNQSGSTPLFTNFTQSLASAQGAYANILLFPNSTNSGSFILSGSRNIGTINPLLNAGATIQRGGGNLNGNIGNFNIFYSTASSPATLANNFVGGAVTNALNNTSSTVTLSGNFIGGAILVTGSSPTNVSITTNNIDAALITNDFTGSGANQSVSVFSNLIKGGLSQPNFAQIKFAATQSNGNSRAFTNNIMFGPANIASLEASGAVASTSNLLNTAIIGSNLVVSGTMANNSTSASMFVGQFNEQTATYAPADPSVVKFAVGTGTSAAARRTSFQVLGTGDVVIAAAGGGISSRAHTQFSQSSAQIVNSTINAQTTVGAYNGSFVTNGGSISAGVLTSVLIASEQSTISAGRSSAIVGASYNTINTNTSGDSNTVIVGSFSNTISGSNAFCAGIYSSTGSFINEGKHSAIIGANNARLNNTTGSVALGRDTAYTGSASYTLYTQNVNLSGSLVVNGNTQYNFGEFFSTASVTPSAGVSQSVVFDTTVDTNNVAISGSGALIKVTNAGTYNIQFSIQVNTSAGADTLYVWYKKNGTNITNSASKAVLANNTAQLLTVNIIDNAAANDYYEVAYQTANGNAQILAEAASGNIPAIPSVILTVTQVR